MDNIDIERENVTKFLGVLIDENLSWKQHINNVSTKTSKSLIFFTNLGAIVKQPPLNSCIFLSFTVN